LGSQLNRLKLIVRVCLCSIAFATLILIFLFIPPFNRPFLSFANHKVSSILLCKADIGTIFIDIQKGMIAKNIVLSDTLLRYTPLYIQQISVQVDLKALAKGRLKLRSVKIAGVNGKLFNTKRGLFAGPVDIGKITAPDPKLAGKHVDTSEPVVKKIYAERCTVLYVDSAAQIYAKENISFATVEIFRVDSLPFVLQAGGGYFLSTVWHGSVRTLDAQGTVSSSSLQFKKAEIRGDSVLLSLVGIIPFNAHKVIDVAANAEAFVAGFSQVYKNVKSLKPIGKIKVGGRISGSMEYPVINAIVNGYGLQAEKVYADSLLLRAEYSSGILRSKVNVLSRSESANVSVVAAISNLFSVPVVKRYTVELAIKQIDLKKHFPFLAKSKNIQTGRANGTFYAAVYGTVSQPDSVFANVNVYEKDNTTSPLNMIARLTKSRWNLIAAISPYFNVTGDGLYDGTKEINGLIHIKADSAGRIISLLTNDSVAGSISADAIVSGSLKKPVVSVNVNIGKSKYRNYSVDTISTHCSYDNKQLQWQSLYAKHGTSAIKSNGMVSWTKSWFNLDYLVSDAPVVSVAGELTLDKSVVAGTLQVLPKGSANPVIAAVHIPLNFHGNPAIGNGAVVAVNGDSIAYGDMINAFSSSVKASGMLNLHGLLTKVNDAWNVSCSTHIASEQFAKDKNNVKSGKAILDLFAYGTLANPLLRFSIRGDSIAYQGNLIDAYSGSGSVLHNMLSIDTLHLSMSSGRVDLSANVPLSTKSGISFDNNAHVNARLIAMPLKLVQPFMPEPVELDKGEVSGQVTLNGTVNGIVQANGYVSLKNAELYMYECDKPIGPLSVDIDLKNDSILMRKLQGRVGGGNISGSGWAVIGAKGITTAKSTIKLSNVHLNGCSENLAIGIQTADINISKDSIVNIQVDAVLADTRFTQDYSLVDMSEQMKKNSQQAQQALNPLLDNVAMRITVNCNSNLTFDSNLGKLLVDGSVTVSGRPDKPAITGQFEIVDGFVYYLDRKFTVTQGSIKQYDPERINPVFDVTATTTVSWYMPGGGKEDYDITLVVKDDLSHPVITLSATPSLSQPQIISLLTIGTIQTGMGSDLGSRTGSLVGQQLAGFGTRKIAKFLNVESVDIYGNVFGPSATGPQVSVTKQVSPRISVTYNKGLSTLSQQMVTISYRLMKLFYIEAETDQQAQGGIDLKFRYSH